MKEFIYGWIQDIAFYTLLMEVVLHVLPEQGQKKYLQFFMGIVLIILVISPMLSAAGLDRQLDETYARQTYDQELQEFQKRQQEIEEDYERRLEERVEEAAGEMKELEKQMAFLSRKDIIEEALTNFGAIIVCETMDEAVEFANDLAPEHLEVCCVNPMEYVGRMDNAGSVFLGNYSPEPLGDYFAGPNHVLPTSGTARFFSPLSVDSFVKKSSFIYYTKPALKEAADDIICLAKTAGLTAHANSIEVRKQDF